MKLPYYPSLDGLRGIAAMMVVMFHFYSYPNGFYSEGYTLYATITGIGQHGVSLFFVLSGFVITRILIAAKDETRYFSTFFIRRILRIAPLYYFFLVFWFYILPFIIQYPVAPVSDQLPYVFYWQNVLSTFHIPLSGPPHFWSLAVEEHFYLVWPFVVYYTPINKLGRVIAVSIALIFVLKYFMIQNKLPIHDFTLTRVDQILMGAFLAMMELKGLFRPESVKRFAGPALLTIPVACVVYVLGSRYFFLKEMFKYFLLGITFASLIAIVLSLTSRSVVHTFLTSRVLQYLGKISYGIYVWHVAALIFLQFFLLTKVMVVDMAITVVLTIAFAHVSYFYFEYPFIRLKDHVQPAYLFNLPNRFWMAWMKAVRRIG